MKISFAAPMFIAVFLLGGLSGYLVKPTAAAAPPPARHAAAPCPAGTHVEVWYTVRAWGCVPDGGG